MSTGRWPRIGITWSGGGTANTVAVEQFQTNHSFSASVTTNYLATPSAGNLLLAIAYSRAEDTSVSLVFPSEGWTQVFFSCSNVSGGSCGTANSSYRRTLSLSYRIAVGNETSQQANFSTGSASWLSLIELSTNAAGGFADLAVADYVTSNTDTSAATSLASGSTDSVTGYSQYLIVGAVAARNDSTSPFGMGAATWASQELTDNEYSAGPSNGMSLNIAFAVATSGGVKAATASWSRSLPALAGLTVFGLVE
jgi:hypothetical protein